MSETPIPAEELVALVAHDLRNPLACVEGYAQILLEKEHPLEERRQLLRRILSCSRFAEQIIEDLLDLSAIERGTLEVRTASVALAGVLRRALETLEHGASVKGARLSLACSAADDLVVADEGRLRQVLQNLVSNALKHLPAGRGLILVRAYAAGEEIVIEVQDNGSGIAPEQLGRIFDKFYRADPATRGSLGLGLFIVRRIVEAHGGRVWAESEGEGKGASFFVTLPRFDPERRFREYKTQRGLATPPPRRSSSLAALGRFAPAGRLVAIVAALAAGARRVLGL